MKKKWMCSTGLGLAAVLLIGSGALAEQADREGRGRGWRRAGNEERGQTDQRLSAEQLQERADRLRAWADRLEGQAEEREEAKDGSGQYRRERQERRLGKDRETDIRHDGERTRERRRSGLRDRMRKRASGRDAKAEAGEGRRRGHRKDGDRSACEGCDDCHGEQRQRGPGRER